jgi:hypothetical protein
MENTGLPNNIPPEEFYTYVKDKVVEVLGSEQDIYPYPDDEIGNYFFFPVLDHFQKGLINQDIIKNLVEGNKSVLSVGVGDGNFERVLWQGFKIPESNITIADIKLHSKAKQLPFEHYEFDMTGVWPHFTHSFDYILFPESFGVAFPYGHFGNALQRYAQLLQEELKTKGDIAEDKLRSFMKMVELNDVAIGKKVFALEQALSNLNEGGEIRFSGDLLHWYEEKYLEYKLKQQFPSLHMIREEKGSLAIRK